MVATTLVHLVLAFDDNYQKNIDKSYRPLRSSLILPKEVPSNPYYINSFIINQKVKSDKLQQDDNQNFSNKSLSKNPKYVNKSANSADKKNSMMIKNNISVSQSRAAEDGSWKCPNITDNQSSLECGCDIPLTLRCSGDVHGLTLIAEGLRKSSSQVSILDCTLKNVTSLSESKIFEGVSLSGLFISSGEIKKVHRLAFAGLKIPLQILGLPNNALSAVPANCFQQLTTLDRLDLSNNEIKILSPTDFVSLQKLTYLEISENQISSISLKTFHPLKNLVTLKLNGNKIGQSPGGLKTIAECINLRELDLQSNLIKGPLTTDILPIIKNLESLNLERNSFSSVQNGPFKNFPKLLTLSLRHNQIDVLADDAFVGLSSLQKLDLGYNGIVAMSEGSLKHMTHLVLLDFTHNFLRALTSDMIAPLPQLQEIRLDGNDISIVEKNALTSAKNLKNISLRENPLACDCKLQYFVEWLNNETQLVSKDLMGFCKTPYFLEGAQLALLSMDSLTCAENVSDNDNDHIMTQINAMFNDFNDNFTIVNSSTNIKFVEYNFTNSNILFLKWNLHLNKTIIFHSLVIFEGSTMRMRLDKSTLTYRLTIGDDGAEDNFIVFVPSTTALHSGNLYDFCIVFKEDDYQFFLGCSSSLSLVSLGAKSVDMNSRVLQSEILDSDISSFDTIANKNINILFKNDDMATSYSTVKSVWKSDEIAEHDDSIEVYPSHEYYNYNTLWPNISLSILIMFMSISIIYACLSLWKKYRYYCKHQQTESISPSYSEDSINTQIEDENENPINKYVKLQATTAL